MFKPLFFYLRLIFLLVISSSTLEGIAIDHYHAAKKRNDHLKTRKKGTPRYQLAACLFFQNEAPYLKEWIEYHRLIGFEHFYLFNNESEDNYLEVLQPYIKKGIVELTDVPGISATQYEHACKQYAAYNQTLKKTKKDVKWLALIDADEFIVPIQKDNLLDVLKDYEDHGAVYVNWLMFGTSGCEKIPPNRLMIESLTYCQLEPMPIGKSIVRPERVTICTDAHRFFYHPPYFHVNTNHETFDAYCPVADDKLLINHYYTRDIDHLIHVKFPRRKKWQELDLESYLQLGEALNNTQNLAIQKFVPKLRRRMGLH